MLSYIDCYTINIVSFYIMFVLSNYTKISVKINISNIFSITKVKFLVSGGVVKLPN